MTASELLHQIESAMMLAQRRVRHLVETFPGLYPLFTLEGRWKHKKPHWTNWCDGFLPGMMWLFLESGLADDPAFWRAKAQDYSLQLDARKNDRDVHTLGFIFYHGAYKRWYEATVLEEKADAALFDVALHAADVLSQRFHEEGRYLRAFLGDDSMLIDAVMNVPLLLWAADKTGNDGLRRVAMQTAWTTRKYMVRGDGSVGQQAMFNTRTGEFLGVANEQGYRADSTWSRGLAWSMYGFVDCYEWSKEPRFFETAEANARYFLEHTAPDGIPPWDFDAPATGSLARTQTDSSAAAIAACGLLCLARALGDVPRAAPYRNAALSIVNTLTRSPYLALEPKWEGILKGSVYHIHRDLGVNESSMWGDFYFVEAMNMALAVLRRMSVPSATAALADASDPHAGATSPDSSAAEETRHYPREDVEAVARSSEATR